MTTVPGWVGPTIALSLVIIAIGFVSFVAALLMAGKKAADQMESLGKEVAELRKELRPTITALNAWVGSSIEVTGEVKDEVRAILKSSRRLRKSAMRGAGRVRDRLEDLDALYEVVSAEVEETALSVASTLRSVRTGTSALSRIKRFLGRRR
ncbi:MAG: hypothetical protein KF785_03535 [Gemmatimonadales bacterium]|nr:hypothetical protein [Gemmatimonadales bacterium]